jgi:transmembrane sensor
VGEVAAVRHGRVSIIKRMQPEEIARKLAWIMGKLSFQGETLTEAVDELNRYNLRHLIVADPFIREISVGGVFTATDPDSFVDALEHTFHVMGIRPSGDGEVRLIAAPDAHSGDTIAPLEEPGVSSDHAAETR